MRVDQIRKRLRDLTVLKHKPGQLPEVKYELDKEISKCETQIKNIKRCLFGEAFNK